MAALIKKTLTGNFGYVPSQVPSLVGKTAIITGGTNGIGLSVARTLYAHGASLYVIADSDTVAQKGLAYIKSGNLQEAPQDYIEGFGGQEDTSGGGNTPGKVEFVKCDLEDLKAVSVVAKELKEKVDRLDVFIGIAGKGVNAFSLTADGYDSHLTLNNLSHHLLLSHLFPLLKKTSSLPGADVRIVQMSSELHRATFGGPGPFGGKFKSIEEFKEDVGPSNLYARTKACVLLFTKAIVQRHLPPPSPILAYATHPGAVATGQQDQFKPAYGETAGAIMGAVTRPFMRRPDQGGLSAVWASVATEARSSEWRNGEYFTDPAEIGGESNETKDQELIDNFYENSEKVIKAVVGADGIGNWKD